LAQHQVKKIFFIKDFDSCIKKRFYYSKINLELGERLGSALGLGDLEDVETNSLGKRTTLTDGNDVTTN